MVEPSKDLQLVFDKAVKDAFNFKARVRYT